VVVEGLDEMLIEPLFREHLPELFARHAHLAALGLAFRVRNSSVSEFLFSGERFSLASFNETPHLADAALVTVR
jgi:hypothetical protein